MNAALGSEFLTGLVEYEDPQDEARRYADTASQVMPGVSSGALLEAMEQPEIFQEIARADLYVQMAVMRRAARDPRFTPNQRLEYMKRLAEMGKVAQPERETAGGIGSLPMINIKFPGSGGSVQIGGSPVREERDITPLEMEA
jgi:hypothetical protein